MKRSGIPLRSEIPRRAPRQKRKPRRNDAPWRAAVLARHGAFCASCWSTRHLQVDHMLPRSQGGASHVLNGLPLCGPFSNDCHGKKTAGTLVIRWEWLDDEQIAWLAEQRWVYWDSTGEPLGRGRKHFGRKPERKGAS